MAHFLRLCQAVVKRKRPQFNPQAVHHVYQRAVDKGIIFYKVEDRVVYMTLAATKAKNHNVIIVAAAIMFSHIHFSVIAQSRKDIEDFLHDLNTSFARMYNINRGRKGQLFQTEPDIVPKAYDKAKRTNLIYVFNNHVEKKLCSKALEERWSFLAYSQSNHPFSEKINYLTISKPLRKAINFVRRRHKNNTELKYSDVVKLFTSLSAPERDQLLDFTISEYALVDFSYGINLFGSLENMITAINSSTGSEYDTSEVYTAETDRAYVTLIGDACSHGYIQDIYSMSQQKKTGLILDYLYDGRFSHYQLEKFFHVMIQTH